MSAGSAPPAAVVFDFDGVILESVEIKTEAFLALFADRPEHHGAIRDLHHRLGGISRGVKIELIHRDILGLPLSPADKAALEARFARLVVDRVLACPMVPGVEDALCALHRAGVPLFVASGTPEEELRALVRGRGLAPWFRAVYGSPRSKTVLLELIAASVGVPGSALLMIGDALTDHEAAVSVGALFLGRVPPGQSSPFPPGTRVVADLTELAETVTTHGVVIDPPVSP